MKKMTSTTRWGAPRKRGGVALARDGAERVAETERRDVAAQS
jgi:hypothetical protein